MNTNSSIHVMHLHLRTSVIQEGVEVVAMSARETLPMSLSMPPLTLWASSLRRPRRDREADGAVYAGERNRSVRR